MVLRFLERKSQSFSSIRAGLKNIRQFIRIPVLNTPTSNAQAELQGVLVHVSRSCSCICKIEDSASAIPTTFSPVTYFQEISVENNIG